MDTSTRLPGHGLQSEGKPYVWRQGDEEDAPSWRRVRYPDPVHLGSGVCSCGASSTPLESDGARKRWHKAHKDEMRPTPSAPGGAGGPTPDRTETTDA